MLPSILAKEIIQGLRDYITTGFETSTPYFKGIFTRFVKTPGLFIKGPYLSLSLPFKQGNSRLDYFSSFKTAFPPFLHQQQAWQRLSSDKEGLSTLIATGTGSGKTECFLYPILDHCARSPESGVKAIIIYPMNALATDQAKRFAETVFNSSRLKGKVRVGLFVGGMEEMPSKMMTAESVITDKNILRKNPPDILLTNYKMLDFLLLRLGDQPLWQDNTPETLRYLIVDELHTFDGAQGTDLACLIRRLKARLVGNNDQLICAGTSATLGSGDEIQALTDYASQIFQSEFNARSIIGEHRVGADTFLNAPIEYVFTPPDEIGKVTSPGTYGTVNDYLAAQYHLFFPDSPDAQIGDAEWHKELGEQLKRHLLFNNLLRLLVTQPRDLTEISQELKKTIPAGSVREYVADILNSLCALVAIARDENGHPLVNLRLQVWVRELRRMVTLLKSEGDERLPQITYADDLKQEDDQIYLPLIQCNHCNTTAWLTRKNNEQASVITELRKIYSAYFKNDPESIMLLPLLDEEDVPQADGFVQNLCRSCGQLQTDSSQCLACGDNELSRVFTPNLVRERKIKGVPRLESEYVCPVCRTKDSMMVFGARSASLSSVAIHHTYSSPYNDDKKLIAFSDGVQDAAHRAGFFAARTWQNNVRMAISQSLMSGRMKLADSYRNVSHFWMDKSLNPEAMGLERFVTEFLAPNMLWYRDYISLVETGALPKGSNIIEDVSKRLEWEVFAEFGYRARVGRSLEQTGTAALGVERDAVDKAVEQLIVPLRENEGLSNLTEGTLSHFLFGLILYLKNRGGIYHPFAKSYIEQGGKNYQFTRLTYLPSFAPHSDSPVYVTDATSHREFECLIPSNGKSWYQHWFDKTLGADEGIVAIQTDQSVYIRVMKVLEVCGVLLSIKNKGNIVWALNPEVLYISSNVLRLETDNSRDHIVIPEEMAEVIAGMKSLSLGDESLYQISPTPASWLKEIYQHGDIRRVIAEEHTGLLERDIRESIEKRFIKGEHPWDPNLLSATPTLEMGIDIGDLSSLLLCSVPPSQANYLQRIGRAGRRDGNAFNMTVAQGAPHDLYFFADPLQMMAGRVEPPGIFLNASAVISRQLTAYCMDRWVISGISAGAIPGKMKPVLDNVKNGDVQNFPFNFINFIEKQLIVLLDDFLSLFGDELSSNTKEFLLHFIRGDGVDDGLSMRLVKRLHELLEEREEFRKRIDILKRHLDKLKKQPGDEVLNKEIDEVEIERSGLQQMLRKINGTHALNFLTDEGLLPNYAFPEEGVTLRSVIFRRKKEPKEGEGRFENIVYEYSRSGSSAINELVPYSSFYAGGRKVSIQQIDMKLSSIENWQFCPSCSYSRIVSTEGSPDSCPRCADPMWSDSGQYSHMLRLKQVMANTSDKDSRIGDDSDDREPHFYTKQTLLDFDAKNIASAYRLPGDEVPFGFEFIRGVTFREINFGEYGSDIDESSIAGEMLSRPGFKLCKQCGTVQDKWGCEQQHAYACTLGKDTPEDEDNLVSCLYLYRDFKSEALRILLPVITIEDADRFLNSFIAGLQLGLKLKFGGQVDHLRVMTYGEPIENSEAKRRFMVLYDSVPGGTGYLQDLMQSPTTLLEIFSLARDTLSRCSCNQEVEKDGCYQCLYAYRNSHGMESTSRDTAISLFNQIIDLSDKIEEIETIDDILVNPVLESELETRFISAIHSQNHKDLNVKIWPHVVSGKPGYFLQVEDNLYTIEPQKLLNKSDGVVYPSKPDFLIRSARTNNFKPIAVFLDGYKYHKEISADDSAKRLAIVQSNQYYIWSLSWDDVQLQTAKSIQNGKNLFTEGLHPEMKVLQDKLVSLLHIGSMYKYPVCSPLKQLLQFLSDPDPVRWQALVFVRILGWFDQATMREASVASQYRERFEAGSVSSLAEKVESLQDAAFGGVGEPGDMLRIDCAIPLSAISQSPIQTDMPVCNILLDDHVEIDDATFKSHWKGFFRVYNLLQFLPFTGFSTLSGVKSGVCEEIVWQSDISSYDGKNLSQNDGLDKVLQDAVDELKEPIKAIFDKGISLPEVYYAIEAEDGEILGEAELVWHDKKIACLLNEQMGQAEVFVIAGWTVIEINQGTWLKKLFSTMKVGEQG